MKHAEEIMEILEAFDLTRSFRSAADLAGCDHHTVAHWVARRDAGELSATASRRDQLIDPYLAKLEEWMQASNGKVRADVAHDKLLALGYAGSERTTRRAVGGRARPVVPVGLRCRADGGRGGDLVVLRVAGVEPVPGGAPDPGQDLAKRDRMHRRDAAPLRGVPDLRADR